MQKILFKITYLLVGTTSVLMALVVLYMGASAIFSAWLLVVATGLLSFGASAAIFAGKTLLFPERVVIPTVLRERVGLVLCMLGIVGYTFGTVAVVIFILLLGAYYDQRRT